MRQPVRLVAAMLALMVAACETASFGDAGTDPLSNNDWIAISIADAPVSAKTPVTLMIANGRVSGRSGCNQYSGAVDYDDRHLKVGQVISTKMACIGDGLMELESRYLGALQGAQGYALGRDGHLVISGSAGKLDFAPSPRQVRP